MLLSYCHENKNDIKDLDRNIKEFNLIKMKKKKKWEKENVTVSEI